MAYEEINVKEILSPQLKKRIGFGTRLFATLIDGILMLLSIFIFSMVFMTSMPFNEALMAMLQGGAVMTNAISLLYLLPEAFVGATIGKMILGIQVANEAGEKDTSLYFKRYLIKNSPLIFSTIMLIVDITSLGTISAILSFAFIIGCFFTLGEKKQALHDILAKSAVFNKSDISNISKQ